MGQTDSVNDIRTAIRELTARAELASKEGRPGDADELEARIAANARNSAATTLIRLRLKHPAGEMCCGETRSAARRHAP